LNNRKSGTIYEQKAVKWLSANDIKVITTNFRCRFGEIDIVAVDGEYLVFVEVKYRRDTMSGHPAEAVTLRKQKTISKVADYYRITQQIDDDHPVRFDVVAICGDVITWYRDAFSYIRSGY
jgi:putative endonuclease